MISFLIFLAVLSSSFLHSEITSTSFFRFFFSLFFCYFRNHRNCNLSPLFSFLPLSFLLTLPRDRSLSPGIFPIFLSRDLTSFSSLRLLLSVALSSDILLPLFFLDFSLPFPPSLPCSVHSSLISICVSFLFSIIITLVSPFIASLSSSCFPSSRSLFSVLFLPISFSRSRPILQLFSL